MSPLARLPNLDLVLFRLGSPVPNDLSTRHKQAIYT
jgi:hypothetical protein